MSHLHPKAVRYEQLAKGDKPPLFYDAEILFSLHCFTRRLKDAEVPDATLLYSDHRESRVFDFRRYELSKQLPEIMERLSYRKCYHTGNGNFFTLEIVNAEDGSVHEYDIFFTASRSSRRGVVTLFVQSAYVRDDKHGSNRPHKKPLGFNVILFNTLNNKPIRFPE